MRGLLAGLADLAADAWGLLAVLVRPLPCPALETLSFEAIVRLAAGGPTPEAARAHLRELAAGSAPLEPRTPCGRGASGGMRRRQVDCCRSGAGRACGSAGSC